MKVILAFDSFKGCISAAEACRAASEGIKEQYPHAEIIEIPLSDGGEGLVNGLSIALSNTDKALAPVTIHAHGPLMEPLNATYAISLDGKTAYMEMAATSGLPLVPKELRNPMNTTTYGVGDMIADAISRGCTEIVMGIGGSATNDAGQGMIKCLKERGMLDAKGIISDHRLKDCIFRIACDVSNPLCGENGASYIFGPQKGATPEQVEILDRMLHDFAQETVANGIASADLETYPGTGAAGGLGYGLKAYLKAELLSGIDIILDLVHFDHRIEGADLIITGEGKSDEQTLMGKVPFGVLRRAQAHNIPVALLSGAIQDTNGCLSHHFTYVRNINEHDHRPLEILMTPEVAKQNIRSSFKDFGSAHKKAVHCNNIDECTAIFTMS